MPLRSECGNMERKEPMLAPRLGANIGSSFAGDWNQERRRKPSRYFIECFRVYLKTPNAPGQRTFSRCAAPFFLEIRQYSCEKMSCSAQKFLAAGHIGSFQIHPTYNSEKLQKPMPLTACFAPLQIHIESAIINC